MRSPIMEYRINHGLTQIQFAQQIGIPQNTISQYETGQRKPRPPIALKIAEFIGCPIDALYGREPPGEVEQEQHYCDSPY